MDLRQSFHWLILLTFIASLLGPVARAQPEADSTSAQAQALLASMTPEERVGQLFLVTFQGTDTNDQITDL